MKKSMLFLLSISSFNLNAACLPDVNGSGGTFYVSDTGVYKPGNIPAYTSIQQAVDMAKECEFQISGFTAELNAQVQVIQGSPVITNLTPSVDWSNEANNIEPGELIKFGNYDYWYEVKEVNGSTITLSRNVDIASGSYPYSISTQMTIMVSSRSPSINHSGIDLGALHYLTIQGSGTPDQPANSVLYSRSLALQSPLAPTYGHLTIDNMTIISYGSGILFLGNLLTPTQHDIDLTITDSNLVSVDGWDVVKCNYQGNIVITRSRFESSNDVAFFPYSNSYTNPRSVVISSSSFLTRRTAGFNPGIRKVLTIGSVANGTYSIINSNLSASADSLGFLLGFYGDNGATLNVTNTNFEANSTDTAGQIGSINISAPPGVVGARGNIHLNINDSEITTKNSYSCVLSADEGAGITLNNTNGTIFDSYNNLRACTYSGGSVTAN